MHSLDDIYDALDERQRRRARKDWKGADDIKIYIEYKGLYVKDTPKGYELKNIKVDQ